MQNERRIEWPQMLISAAANTLTLQRRQERGCVIRSQQQRSDEDEHKSMVLDPQGINNWRLLDDWNAESSGEPMGVVWLSNEASVVLCQRSCGMDFSDMIRSR